jgi:glycosyltransferase involved in cell wall biosynthesis
LPLEDAVVIPYPAPLVPHPQRWRLADCDRKRILFVGRFDRHKGGDVVVDCLRKLLRTHPGTRLWFVGPDDGLTDEDGRRWNLARYIAERAPEVAAAIDWLGRLTHAVIDPLRRQAALTIVGSRYEVFGLVVLEAMARGCPLVATRTGGIAEIVEDGVNGLLCRPGDADDMAAKVASQLDNPELAARLGERAGEDAAGRYHPDGIARATAEFHGEVLSRARAKSGRRSNGPLFWT